MTSHRWQVSAVLVMAVFCAGAVFADDEEEAVAEPAAEPSTNFEATVDLVNLQTAPLDGAAGEVQVKSVELVVSNAKSGGITGAFSSNDTEIKAVITTTISCEAAVDAKWKLDFLVEFLDEKGNVIDRVASNGSLKKNKKFDFKHTTLKWALEHVKQARVSVAASQ